MMPLIQRLRLVIGHSAFAVADPDAVRQAGCIQLCILRKRAAGESAQRFQQIAPNGKAGSNYSGG